MFILVGIRRSFTVNQLYSFPMPRRGIVYTPIAFIKRILRVRSNCTCEYTDKDFGCKIVL